MALSEEEQRKLDQIERALRRDDPGFASLVNIGWLQRHRRLLAALVFVGGLLALLAGAVLALGAPVAGVVISAVGFMVMVAGVWLLVPGRRGAWGHGAGSRGAHPGSKRSRMEERLRNRFDHPDGQSQGAG